MLCRVLAQEQSLLPRVLGTFLGSCGMGHPDEVHPFCLSHLHEQTTDLCQLRQEPRSLAADSPHRGVQALGTRACYLFCRLVKALRSELQPHLAEILLGLEPHLRAIITSPRAEAPQGTKPSAGALRSSNEACNT